MIKTNVTIIGFGTMGKAIAQALFKNDKKIKIFSIDLNKKNTNGIKISDFIILAVKPQNAGEAIKELKKHGMNKKTILISIMAGYSIKKILQFSNHKKIVRMMPNLGISVNAGIAGWKQFGLSKDEIKKTKIFMNKITQNFEVKKEDILNKITAISGSGPAYFLFLADSLLKASQKLGLNEKEAKMLVQKTFLASANLSEKSDYSVLIKKITSKKGTTEAALEIFKKKNFDKIVLEAVQTAYQRAKKLNN